MLQKNLNDLFGPPNTFGILQSMDVIEGRRIHKISQGGDGGEGKKALKNWTLSLAGACRSKTILSL